MNVKSMKKGFTLTELIIVIVIIGILAGVLIPTFINVVNKANKAADLSLIRNLNEALTIDKLEKGEHKNMTQALEAAEEYGYLVDKISAKSSKNKILWDSKNDVFCYLTEDGLEYYPKSVSVGIDLNNPEEVYLLWIIDNKVNSKFSTYLYGYSGTTSESNPLVASGVGLDTGEYDVAFVKYVNNNATDNKKVVIRTNSAKTTLIIDDNSAGSIEHYESVGALNIIKCNTASYHENGKVAFVEIKSGRIALESGSEVEHIHLNKTGNEFVNIIVAKAENVEMPDFSRDKVDSIPDTGVLVVALQEGTDENDEKEYVWLTEVGIYEQVTLGTADAAGTNYAAASSSQEKKYAAQQIANNITFSEDGQDYKVTATKVNDEWTYEVKTEAGQTTSYTAIVDDGVVTVKDSSHNPVETTAENGLSADEKQAAKTEAVNEAIESVEYAGVAVTITGEPTQLMTLEAFRDSVNSGNSYAGYVVKLLDNIDLKGVDWTPIGTTAHPFSGVFDGQYFTISNLSYNGAPTAQQLGLFGNVVGTVNSSAMSKENVWNDNTNSFIEDNVIETKYTAVIKNLNLTGFSIINTSEEGSNRYTGALAGSVRDAYICNITVGLSTIKGTKGVGGLVGTFEGSTAKDCKTLSSVSVEASKYNAGGLFGGTNYANTGSTYYGAIINCENNASVTCKGSGGNAGGIVGMSQSAHSALGPSARSYVYVNCVNRGSITQTVAGADRIGGIVGSGINVIALLNCENYGSFNIAGASYVAGIQGCGQGNLYNCCNHVDITANANKLAGISIEDSANTGKGLEVVGSSNYGKLNNTSTEPNSSTALICMDTSHLILTNQTYDNVAAVNAVIEAGKTNVSIEFVDCTVIDTNGALNLYNTHISITSNTKICSSVDVDTIESGKWVHISIPNISVNISGDASNKMLSLSGENNTVTINQGANLGALSISGNNSSVSLSGIVENISMSGTGAISTEITSTGKAGKVGFSGTGTYILTNRGLISHTQSDSNPYANDHVVCTIKPCTIEFNNYGRVESFSNTNGVCSYACLFYNGCNVVVNQYDGSSIVTDKNGGYLLACGSANSVIYNTYDANGVLTDSIVKK